MKLRSAAAATCLILISQSGFAALVENTVIGSAKATALANAVTADPPGIDSIHYNPAGLAKLKGRQYTVKALGFYLSPETDFGKNRNNCIAGNQEDCLIPGYVAPPDPLQNTTSESDGITLALPIFGATDVPFKLVGAPLIGFSYNPEGTNITFATQTYLPVGAGYKRAGDDPGRYNAYSFGLTRLTMLSPSVAVQLNDQWAVGASMGISWEGIALGMDVRLPNMLTALTDSVNQTVCDNPDFAAVTNIIDLCGGALGPFTDIADVYVEAEDTISLSYNFGVLWEPNEWFSWGLTYRTASPGELEGDFTLTYGQEFSDLFGQLWREAGDGAASLGTTFLPIGNYDTEAGVQRVEKGKISASFDIPQHISTGVSVKVTPTFKVNVDLHWSDWGIMESLPLVFDSGDLDFLKVTDLIGLTRNNTLEFPRNYKSLVNVAMGAEYIYDDRLTLRAGIEDRRASIPLNKADVTIPFGASQLISGGLSYQWSKKTTVELAGGFMISNQDVKSGVSDNSNSNSQGKLLYNPYMGLDYETTTTIAIFNASITSTF